MKTLNSIPALFTIMGMLLLSIILLSVWGYHHYFSGNKQAAHRPVVVSDSTVNSIMQIPDTQAVTNEKSSLRNEVTTALLREKLGELELLKAEITAILAKRNDTAKVKDSIADFGAGKKETDTPALHSDINDILDSLKMQNDKIAAESYLLTKTVHKVKKELEKNTPKNDKPHKEEKALNQKAAVFISNLDLFALKADRTTTTKAGEAKYFYGSFLLNSAGEANGALFIRIRKPDGKTIITSEKIFDTSDSENTGRLYSLRVHFTHNRQRVSFNLPAQHLPKGVYSLEVYYRGLIVAQSSKTMS